MRITFVNQKGGVGKSTVCVAIGAALWEAGFDVGFEDSDPQGSVSFWAQHIGRMPVVSDDCRPAYLLCDTPGRLDFEDSRQTESLQRLICSSERVVLVTEQSLFSVHATAPMVRFVRAHKHPETRVYLLLNKVRPNTKMAQYPDHELAQQLGVPLASCALPQSRNFHDLQTRGWAALNRRQCSLVRRLALEFVT